MHSPSRLLLLLLATSLPLTMAIPIPASILNFERRQWDAFTSALSNTLAGDGIGGGAGTTSFTSVTPMSGSFSDSNIVNGLGAGGSGGTGGKL